MYDKHFFIFLRDKILGAPFISRVRKPQLVSTLQLRVHESNNYNVIKKKKKTCLAIGTERKKALEAPSSGNQRFCFS